MKLRSYPVRYSLRILVREWQKYILPFFSLTLTALVVTVALSLTGSVSIYLENEAKSLIGGDVSIDSNFAIDESQLFDGIPTEPDARTRTINFNGTIRNVAQDRVLPVSIDVVDESFPLYGVLALENSQYGNIGENEVLIDRAAAKKLEVSVGGEVYIGEVLYTVVDVITREPDVLLNTFRIFPKVILSESGFARSGIDVNLLRAEYEYAYRFEEMTSETVSFLKEQTSSIGSHFHFADDNHSGFSFGFEAITRFLIVAVLITALLAAVNVYASTVYLLDRLQRSVAVLRALGVPLGTVRTIVFLTFTYIAVCGTIVGIIGGYFVARYARVLSEQFLEISLPTVISLEHIVLVSFMVGATGIAALIPSLEGLSRISPRALLLGKILTSETKNTPISSLVLTSLACIPILLIASFLLGSFVDGFITIAIVIAVYLCISFIYRIGVEFLYRVRNRFGFSLRSVISWKRYDGLFGIISFSSLYVALTALFVLALTQTSLQAFLVDDIGTTAPSVYVLDVQEDQAKQIQEQFPDVTLFTNVSGRLLTIDSLDVQAALEDRDGEVDRELRREFMFTYRTNLIEGESITSGSANIGQQGTVSVDEEFAVRANISLGSRITVSIQGFPITAEVTSLRATDSRSGLPFFYFVFSPEDLASFPASYFGYAYIDDETQKGLLNFIGRTMPNVSSIDTTEIGILVQNTLSILLAIVFYIVLPPFILACALILVLVILQYSTRRRDGARLLALGALPRWIERQYVFEMMSTTVLASICAYLTAIATSWYVATQYLQIDVFTFYNNEVLYGLLGILGGLCGVGIFLWRSDKRPLREFLAYEDNH